MESTLLFAILTPVLGAFLLPLLGLYSSKARNVFALVLVCLSFTASALLLGPVFSGKTTTVFIPAVLGMDLIFSADALGD